MSAEEHKDLVRRFNEEAWNRGNLGVIDDLFAGDWVWHAPPGMPTHREGLKQMAGGFGAAFSDIRTTIDDQVAEGDRVAWRWTFRARHTGDFMGIPATGKEITFTGISVDRIAGGKFVERWDCADMLGLLQQLGAIQAAGGGGG